jgi:hypothetical protein
MIEAYLAEDDDGDVTMEEKEEEKGDVPEISLHTIMGKDVPDTMKVYGLIGRSMSLVLINSGSTHNFVSLALAQLLKLQPTEGGKLMVASGEKIKSLGKCIGVPLDLQGWKFQMDFYILPLEGYELVLGTQ